MDPAQQATLDRIIERLDYIESRLAEIGDDVETIKSHKPGRKGKPILTSEVGVCGLDPTCDSSKCDDATIYRYQKGCRGTRCVEINRDYYSDYRAKNRNKTSDE